MRKDLAMPIRRVPLSRRFTLEVGDRSVIVRSQASERGRDEHLQEKLH